MNELEENVRESEGEKRPSVTSTDARERKLARRLRIERRLKEAARLQAISEGTYTEPISEKLPLDGAIETSQDILENLFLEGKDLVSNVRVASDAREVQRREFEVEGRTNRIKVLEEEAALALEKLSVITSRWEVMQDLNDPLHLHQHMKEQKSKCLDLIQQKNDLIKNFQLELKLADEKYMKDRHKMYEDLALLTQRIDEQVLVMKRAYRLELKNIGDVVDSTRSKLISEHQQSWQLLYNQREKNEVRNLMSKFNMVENHDVELDELHKEHEEKYRETRIRFETDIQILEQELERVKALCLLNSEKLDYNYQVLKKREEENIYIKNHQKRKLNRLQDMVNSLKKKIEEKQNSRELELKRLHQEVLRYHANVTEIEKKAEHFSQMNEDTYQSIWNMKDQEAKDKLNKILSIDRIIHEQILGISWIEPDIKLYEKAELPSYKSAEKVINELFVKPEERKHNIDLGDGELSESRKLEFEEGHRSVLRQILEIIADQSGFLVEEKLEDLLKPYSEEEKTLMRLDNVFTAIGIQTERDVNLMKNVFLPYAMCPLCDLSRTSEQSVAPDQSAERTPGESQHTGSQTDELEEKLIMENSGESLVDSVKAEGSDKKESVDPVQLLHRDETVGKHTALQCSITHPLMIEKIYVLNALKDFVTEYHANRCSVPAGMAARLAKQRNTISRLLDNEDVEKYWKRFKEIFPESREKLWNALFVGLSRYHALLQERHRLNSKAQRIRKQNLELRRLLCRYVTDNSGDSRILPHLTSTERNVIDMEYLHDVITKVKV